MDRHRGVDRYGNSSPSDSHSYRYPRGGGGGGPPPSRGSDDSPINRHRGGFSGNRRPYDSSPPRYSLSSGGGGGFRQMDGDGGFRPMGGRGGRSYNNSSSEFEVPLSGQKRFSSDYEVPMSGQKRQFPFAGRAGGSPPDRFDGGSFDKKNFDGASFDRKNFDGGSFDKKNFDGGSFDKKNFDGGSFDKKNFDGGTFDKKNFDGGSFDKKNFDGGSFDKKYVDGGGFAKLFIGSVPKTATEEDIRPVFEEHGNVVEVALIKDKRTGQQQGICKYIDSSLNFNVPLYLFFRSFDGLGKANLSLCFFPVSCSNNFRPLAYGLQDPYLSTKKKRRLNP